MVRGPATATALPAIVVLHGYDGRPDRIEHTSGWSTMADQGRAVVAYPVGTPVGSDGFGWNTGTARFSTKAVDDVAYLRQVVDALVRDHCVDPTRVVLTGESNGGAMAVKAACDPRFSGAVRLAAPVIPAIDAGTLGACGSAPPIPTLAIAGRRDQVIPYDGHYTAGVVPLLGQEAWFARYTQAFGCGGSSLRSTPIDDAQIQVAQGCAVPMALVAVDDAVHTWPGGPVGTGGLPPGRFPAMAFIWERAGLS